MISKTFRWRKDLFFKFTKYLNGELKERVLDDLIIRTAVQRNDRKFNYDQSNGTVSYHQYMNKLSQQYLYQFSYLFYEVSCKP